MNATTRLKTWPQARTVQPGEDRRDCNEHARYTRYCKQYRLRLGIFACQEACMYPVVPGSACSREHLCNALGALIEHGTEGVLRIEVLIADGMRGLHPALVSSRKPLHLRSSFMLSLACLFSLAKLQCSKQDEMP